MPLALFSIGFPIYEYLQFGFNNLTILFSPIYIICGVLAWKIRNTEKRNITICQQYLKFDDFTLSKIPWGDILDFSIVHLNNPRGKNFIWLKVYFVNNEQYCKKNFFESVNFPVIDGGINIGSIMVYEKSHDEILFILKNALEEYSPNKKINKDCEVPPF